MHNSVNFPRWGAIWSTSGGDVILPPPNAYFNFVSNMYVRLDNKNHVAFATDYIEAKPTSSPNYTVGSCSFPVRDGKHYWETTVSYSGGSTTSDYLQVGIGCVTDKDNYTGPFIRSQDRSFGLGFNNSSLALVEWRGINSFGGDALFAEASGSLNPLTGVVVVRHALDLEQDKYAVQIPSFVEGGGFVNKYTFDMSTEVGYPNNSTIEWYPFFAINNAFPGTPINITFNFGDKPFTYSVPSGYRAGFWSDTNPYANFVMPNFFDNNFSFTYRSRAFSTTGTNTFQMFWSDAVRGSGKWYWETRAITFGAIPTLTNHVTGIIEENNFSYNSRRITAHIGRRGPYDIGCVSSTGQIFKNNLVVATISTPTGQDARYRHMLDLDSGTYQIALENNSFSPPISVNTSVSYRAAVDNALPNVNMLYTNPDDFAYSIPSGYSPLTSPRYY